MVKMSKERRLAYQPYWDSLKGKKMPESTKNKISNSNKGKPKPIGSGIKKGQKMSKKARENIRKSSLGRIPSKETRKKMSESQKRINNKPPRMTGSNHPKWNGGITNLRKRIASQKRYLNWRSSVFKRDNYHCQKCGEKGYLEAHHIIPFREIIKKFGINSVDDALACSELWDVGNGISLCLECHCIVDEKRNKFAVVKC